MKLTGANKLILATLLAVSACHYKPEKELICGSWKYIAVMRDDTSAMAISDNDFMRLGSDSSFEYHISSVNKDMKGSWSYDKHTLHLHYQKPDTTRHFEVDLLSKYRLQIHEGNMAFTFTRID